MMGSVLSTSNDADDVDVVERDVSFGVAWL